MLLALVAWNLGNFLFFLVAGRVLGPADYGLVAALLAATMVVMVPAGAFQYALAREEGAGAVAFAEARGAIYRKAYLRSLWMAPGALAVVAVAIILAGVVVDGLPTGPMLMTLLVVLPMAPLFLSLGQLQAERRFGALSVSIGLLGVPRPIAMGALAAVGGGVSAALGASALSVAVAALAAVALTAGRLGTARPAAEDAWRDFVHALLPLGVGLTGIALLTNLDVIVAKAVLDDQEAGEFGAISVLAKAIILVPQAASIVLLPRVAARRAGDRDTGPLLAAAMTMTLAVGGVASLVMVVIAEPVVRLTFGAEYAGGSDLLAPFMAASTLLGALIVLLNHHAGRRADAFVWAVAGVALAQPLIFLALHGNGAALVAADAITYALGIAVHEVIHGRGPDGILRGIRALVARGGRAPGAW